MPIDWMQPLQTSHDKPRRGVLLPDDGIASRLGKRRVQVSNLDGGQLRADKEPFTVWLFDEKGHCNTSGHNSLFDLVNVTDALAKAA
jgi:hypothetical protein